MEWKRIFSNRRMLLLTLLLLFATIGIYLYAQFQSTANNSYGFQDKLACRKELSREISEISLEEADKMIARELKVIEKQWEKNMEAGIYDDTSLDCRYSVLQEEQKQVAHLLSYPDYLENILNDNNNLSNISIFKKSNSFASENLKRTSEDYAKLQGVQVSYGRYNGVTSVMEYDFVHYSILMFAFILVWAFFEDEKKGLKCITYASPYGRGRLAVRRIGILAGGTGIFTIVSYVALFLCGFILYGGTESLGNSIQSIEMFQTCNLRLSVAGYIIYYVLMHVLITFVMSLFLWMILLLWRNRIFATAVLIFLLAGETILSLSLKEQSVVAFLKYENLYYMINPTEILGTYRNYKAFGMLTNCLQAFFIMVVFLLFLCSVVCVRISAKRKTIAGANTVEIAFMRMIKRIKICYHRIIAGLPLLGMELYKILVMQKGIIFLAVWAYLLVSIVDTTESLSFGNGSMMQEVYEEYSGPDDGRLRYYYLKPQEELLAEVDEQYEAALAAYEEGRISDERMNSIIMRYQGYDALRRTVALVQSHLSYVERVQNETGIRIWFMEQKGYKIMMSGDGLYEGAGYGNQERYALYAVVLLVLLLSMVFSYDHSCGMEKLLYATPFGRKRLFHIKIGIAACLCLIICAVTYGLEFYEIQNTYPLTCMDAPVQSLTFMEKFPLHISTGAFLIWLEVIHFLTLFAVCMMVYCFSAYLRDTKSLLAGLLILAAPSVMYLLGMEWCGYISVTQPVIFVEALQNHGFAYSVICVLVELLIGGICYGMVRRKWCSRTLRRREKK